MRLVRRCRTSAACSPARSLQQPSSPTLLVECGRIPCTFNNEVPRSFPGSIFKLELDHEHCGYDSVAGRGGTANLAAAVDDDPEVTTSAQRTAAARVRHQSLRIPDHGVPVGSARIEAADERAGRDDRQLVVPVIPGCRPPGEAWLDVPA